MRQHQAKAIEAIKTLLLTETDPERMTAPEALETLQGVGQFCADQAEAIEVEIAEGATIE